MASLLCICIKHNLSRVSCITNRFAVLSISKQPVRFRSKWLHRRPIKVLSSNNDNDLNEERLKIERGNVLNLIDSQNKHFESSEKQGNPSNTSDERVLSDSKLISEASYIDEEANHEDKIEEDDLKLKLKDYSKAIDLQLKTKSKTKKERKLEKRMQIKAFKIKESAAKDGVPLYTKLEHNDPKLSSMMLIAKSKNKKVRKSYIALEGKRLINDAIYAGYYPEMVFFSRTEDAADLKLSEGVQLYKIPYKTLSLWSDTVTSPGILAILKTPDITKKEPAKDALPLTIVCDNIRDPGNLGCILRGAAAVGCQKIILTKGCVDLWEPKVLRSGAGAHFRTSIVSNVAWEELNNHTDLDASIFLADNNAFEKDDDTDAEEEEEKEEESDRSFSSRLLTQKKNYMDSLPIVPYYGVDFVRQETLLLIIGGETAGLSLESFSLAHERGGVRLNVPLSNNVESLNSGTAFGIIVFEMKRQFLKNSHSKVNDKIQAVGVIN